MYRRDGYESRKNNMDDIRLKPKYSNNGSSAAYIRIEYCSTTILRKRSRIKWSEMSGPTNVGDDIV